MRKKQVRHLAVCPAHSEGHTYDIINIIILDARVPPAFIFYYIFQAFYSLYGFYTNYYVMFKNDQ